MQSICVRLGSYANMNHPKIAYSGPKFRFCYLIDDIGFQNISSLFISRSMVLTTYQLTCYGSKYNSWIFLGRIPSKVCRFKGLVFCGTPESDYSPEISSNTKIREYALKGFPV